MWELCMLRLISLDLSFSSNGVKVAKVASSGMLSRSVALKGADLKCVVQHHTCCQHDTHCTLPPYFLTPSE